ncbi:MAG: hypothetical protein ACTSSH_11730 [Candidatus Heimdallarchaeota archaeon]
MSEPQIDVVNPVEEKSLSTLEFIVEEFLKCEATSEDKAINLAEFNFDILPYKKDILYLIEKKGLLLALGDDEKYYLDYESFQKTTEIEKNKKTFIIVVAIVIPSLLFILLGLAWLLTI